MAAWNIGPFDNDDAVDWCANLESLPPTSRAELVRLALGRAVGGSNLTVGTATQAVAAAATVLQSLTGAQSSESPYAPRFLLGRDDITVTRELRALAVRALDMVIAEGSAWRLLWAESVEEDEALETVQELRSNLASVNEP